MDIPRLEDLRDLGGARVLLRLDLNVPVKDGVVEDDTRIRAALPTLSWLLERTDVVAACTHLGRPKGAPDERFSLRGMATSLEEALGRPVTFVQDCIGSEVERALDEASPGGLLLLENLRFHAGEKSNDDTFAETLAAPFSHYVNDAFGTAHRAHASVAGVVGKFSRGRRAAGRLMWSELDALSRLLRDVEEPYVAIVGGAKISSKTGPVEALLERVTDMALGGAMANTFLLAQGREVGRSLVETEKVQLAREVMERAAARGVRLMLPEDLVVTDSVDSPGRVEVVDVHSVPPDALIVDIGPITLRRYSEALAGARTAFWNGPIGVFEVERFAAGTLGVAEAMAACGGFTVVGGGESAMAVERAGVADRMGHVSTGGGASLAVISGAELPAVTALEQ